MTPASLYVYGVVDASHSRRLAGLLAGLTGVAGQPRTETVGPVAAVVGDAVPVLRAKRRHLLAHHAVLAALAGQVTVLPMRFGVVSPDRTALCRDLVARSGRYQKLLIELAGRVEMNVKVVPDEDYLLREIIIHEPAVRAGRARTAQHIQDQLELGRSVATALAAWQDSAAHDVLARLEPLAVRAQPGPTVPGCAGNIGFLVDSDSADTFGAAVAALDRGTADWIRLRCTGPLPPYSFVAELED